MSPLTLRFQYDGPDSTDAKGVSDRTIRPIQLVKDLGQGGEIRFLTNEQGESTGDFTILFRRSIGQALNLDTVEQIANKNYCHLLDNEEAESSAENNRVAA